MRYVMFSKIPGYLGCRSGTHYWHVRRDAPVVCELHAPALYDPRMGHLAAASPPGVIFSPLAGGRAPLLAKERSSSARACANLCRLPFATGRILPWGRPSPGVFTAPIDRALWTLSLPHSNPPSGGRYGVEGVRIRLEAFFFWLCLSFLAMVSLQLFLGFPYLLARLSLSLSF